MNKNELFYEEESKTARPHKYSINYKEKDARKEFSDVIYPSMVIRSQAETIELQDKEINRLQNLIDKTTNYYLKTLAKNGSMPDEAVEMFNLLEGNK